VRAWQDLHFPLIAETKRRIAEEKAQGI